MDFMIYLTERCNLACKYCETVEDRNKFTQDPTYKKEALVEFLNKAKDLTLYFYGGEPLLNISLFEYILDNVNYKSATLQTNGFFLDNVDINHLNKLKVISLSIDGREECTDRFRGRGCYKKAIEQSKKLRERGYKGEIDARMTISPGLDIEKEVRHLSETKCFDKIHWQLNALFNEKEWSENKEQIKGWFAKYYNPGINKLISWWTEEIDKNNKVIQIVPFTGLMYSFLTGQKANNVRCGAGHAFWTITTEGDIFPCPVMRNFKEFSLGNIKNIWPCDIKPKCMLTEKCTKCKLFPMCGGRCLNANLRNEWDKEGFEMVCDSVYNLIRGLAGYSFMIKDKIRKGNISIKDFKNFHDYEIIP